MKEKLKWEVELSTCIWEMDGEAKEQTFFFHSISRHKIEQAFHQQTDL
jgi:hypothetical protein